jgi:hypothetical protein
LFGNHSKFLSHLPYSSTKYLHTYSLSPIFSSLGKPLTFLARNVYYVKISLYKFIFILFRYPIHALSHYCTRLNMSNLKFYLCICLFHEINLSPNYLSNLIRHSKQIYHFHVSLPQSIILRICLCYYVIILFRVAVR